MAKKKTPAKDASKNTKDNKSSAKTSKTPTNEAPASIKAAPVIGLLTQYVSDLSFESPDAPESIISGSGTPQISISINNQVKKRDDGSFLVELVLNAKAERDSKILFNVELSYCGVFNIQNVPDAQLAPVLMIECPRLLFPFARQILAQVTQSGGFPPIMMEPVDFAAIYRQNLEAMAKQAAEKKPN
ncbi:MAG: protein-export chaperone SecB [Devosiaceae bacterium]|nr:protein-export chaperone SecB [Devosiaceae bacterium]